METQLEILRTGLEGQGVANDEEGNVYFVERALPGDVIVAEVPDTRKRYRDANLVSIITPSSERRESPCAYFQKCGGCDWLDWNYASQLEAKESTIRHTFDRLKLQPKEFLPIIPAQEQLSYRHRIQLHQQGTMLGFFKRRSHDVVDVEKCVVAHPKINEHLTELRSRLTLASETQKVELSLSTSGAVEETWNSAHASKGFVQSHGAQNAHLRREVGEMIARAASEHVLELYSGNGNLTFEYASKVKSVVGVEENRYSIEQAEKSRNASQLENVRFQAGRVSEVLAAKVGENFVQPYDTLLVNPPRKGMGGLLDEFVHRDVKAILYVSCSPPAFSKDVSGLQRKGFQLECVRPIDMFPQTHHIEFVSLFLRYLH